MSQPDDAKSGAKCSTGVPQAPQKPAASAALDKAPTNAVSYVLIECSRCKGKIRVTEAYANATSSLDFRLCNQCSMMVFWPSLD